MQKEAQLLPATYVLAGMREALLENARLYELCRYIWPLLVAAAIAIPVGLKRCRVLRQTTEPSEAAWIT